MVDKYSVSERLKRGMFTFLLLFFNGEHMSLTPLILVRIQVPQPKRLRSNPTCAPLRLLRCPSAIDGERDACDPGCRIAAKKRHNITDLARLKQCEVRLFFAQ